jgi:hypothetical protein
LFGLSTVLGSSVLGSSVLGSSVLGSSVLGSSVLGSSVLGSSVLGSSVLGSSVLATTIVEAYSAGVVASQIWISVAAIGTLIYLELSDPLYGNIRSMLQELRRSWLPVSALLVVLFFIIVALKVWNVIA